MHPGERIVFGGLDVEIEVVGKSGRSSRLRITAPREVPICSRAK